MYLPPMSSDSLDLLLVALGLGVVLGLADLVAQSVLGSRGPVSC